MTSSPADRARRGGARAAAALLLGAAVGPAPAAGQTNPSDGDRRFVIAGVTDSTVTLLAPNARWMRRGAYGIAVDPRNRDVLVGRLRVLSRHADTAVALVTGQTTRMTPDYVAIFRRPTTPTLRQRLFWGGVLAGAAAAAGAAALIVQMR